ncbi:MAG: hypothetical protein Tsb004_18440 [Allomuricauda sp.]
MENLNVVQLDFGFDCAPLRKKSKGQKPNKKKDNDFVFDLMDCMASPIIVFESPWKDIIPEEMLKKVKISRLVASIQNEEMASCTEALVYMMPRTYEAPLPMEWVNIYTWLGLQYAIQFKKKEQIVAASEIAPSKLSDYEIALLDKFRRWIFDKRRTALKSRLKDLKLPKSNANTASQKMFF